MNMCKFEGRNDHGYRRFMDAINLCMRQIAEKKSQITEASTVDSLITNRAGTLSTDEQQAGTGHVSSTEGRGPACKYSS